MDNNTYSTCISKPFKISQRHGGGVWKENVGYIINGKERYKANIEKNNSKIAFRTKGCLYVLNQEDAWTNASGGSHPIRWQILTMEMRKVVITAAYLSNQHILSTGR